MGEQPYHPAIMRGVFDVTNYVGFGEDCYWFRHKGIDSLSMADVRIPDQIVRDMSLNRGEPISVSVCDLIPPENSTCSFFSTKKVTRI